MLELDPLLDLRVGHVIDVLREMPASSVHSVVTSPPYFGLRSYDVEPQTWPDGWHGHLGLEETPELFIEHLVLVFREVRRVLRKDGSLWVNMGDSYAGGGGYAPGAPSNTRRQEDLAAGKHTEGDFTLGGSHNYDVKVKERPGHVPPGYKQKDLLLIPAMLAMALRSDGWYLRSENIWHKLGGMPESVRDRTSREHEHIFHLTRSARYYYDQDAVREPYSKDNRKQTKIRGSAPGERMHDNYANREGKERWSHPDGRIKRSVWRMPTANYPGTHFAVFPLELPTICIQATTSEHGCCPSCGAPWRRVVEAEGESVEKRQARQSQRTRELEIAPRSDGGALQQGVRVGLEGARRTVEWEPTCKCRNEDQLSLADIHPVFTAVPCVVLDPFVGSGTTMVAARRLERSSIGIELSQTYAEAETQKRLSQWWKDPSRPREQPREQETLFS